MEPTPSISYVSTVVPVTKKLVACTISEKEIRYAFLRLNINWVAKAIKDLYKIEQNTVYSSFIYKTYAKIKNIK